jgi:hypothetical protein
MGAAFSRVFLKLMFRPSRQVRAHSRTPVHALAAPESPVP